MDLESDETRRLAEQEVRNMCWVTCHPNVVAYKDCFTLNTTDMDVRFCIVMEYCDGGTMASKIKELQNRQFNEDHLLDWTLDMCLGLQVTLYLGPASESLSTPATCIIARMGKCMATEAHGVSLGRDPRP